MVGLEESVGRNLLVAFVDEPKARSAEARREHHLYSRHFAILARQALTSSTVAGLCFPWR